MDKLFSPMRRDGIATPRKEKALDNKGLEENKLDQTSNDYSKNKPEKLSTARLSVYWVAMMGKGGVV